jgi:hypothetical protein
MAGLYHVADAAVRRMVGIIRDVIGSLLQCIVQQLVHECVAIPICRVWISSGEEYAFFVDRALG